MAIYEILADGFKIVEETSFGEAGIRERTDLQRLLRAKVDVISPDTLIISEEFGEWEDSRRRIDLLGIDKDANLVVIELKRTDDGGHMELQAIRYAAMVSTLTFERAVEVYEEYLRRIGSDLDPQSSMLEFLELDAPDEDSFGQNVRIVISAADFSKELTTAVMWLNEQGLDIRCVRIKPYVYGEKILIDVQQVIPLPEAEQYRVQLREKQQRERESRKFRFYNTIYGHSATSVIRRLSREGLTKESIRRVLKHYGVDINENTLSTQFYDKDGPPSPLSDEQMAEIRQVARGDGLSTPDSQQPAMSKQAAENSECRTAVFCTNGDKP